MATALSEVQGAYWRTGNLNGIGVFRSTPEDGGFFLWCSPTGWLISRTVGVEPETPGAVLTDYLAWGKIDAVDRKVVPEVLHAPFWKKSV